MSASSATAAASTDYIKTCADDDKEYLRRHNIAALFNDMTEQLFKARPENPVEFLTEALIERRTRLLDTQKDAS